MHFSWKKVKSARISQLVNNHLHNSQKRRDGSSLVVETGFPTSLVDLFIKNREKLKKPSRKNRHNQQPASPGDDNDTLIDESSVYNFPPPIPPPLIAGSTTPPVASSRSPSPSPSPSRQSFSLDSNCVYGIPVVESSYKKERGDGRCVDANGVLFGVLKIFVVVILALATKRLAAGITLSAFLLFFLEYVAKHASVLLNRPCSVIVGVLMSIVQNVRRLSRFKEIKLEENKFGRLMQQEYSMYPRSSPRMSSPDQEIQVVETKGGMSTEEEEIQPEDEIMDTPCYRQYRLIELLEKEESINAIEFKRKSKRAKIKSKMKKFVPKKLRNSKKENDHHMPELVEDGNFVSTKEQLDKCTYDSEPENASASSFSNARESSFSTGLYIEEDKFSEMSKEADIKKEEIKAGRAWRLLPLCVIVFIGLIGGRAFALVLTLLWCLLLKLGEKLPIFRSFNHKSD